MTRLTPFQLHRVTSVGEASALLLELAEEAVVYCGGTELLLLLKLGFAEYAHLVDIKPIVELGQLATSDGRLHIGATVTHRQLEHDPATRDGWSELVAMERRVANLRVRTTGTIGGNLAFADPHSDPATFLLAADATVLLSDGQQERRMPLDDFILGPYQTDLRPGELLCAIEVPKIPSGVAMAHSRFAMHERPAATVSAWVSVEGGRVGAARLAVGSVGPKPVLTKGLDQIVGGQSAGDLDLEVLEAVGAAAAVAAGPEADSNGSIDYKTALVGTLARRTLVEAATRALANSGSSA